MRRPRTAPVDSIPLSVRAGLSSSLLTRLLYAQYYDPTSDLSCCYPERLPPHLIEKGGLWVLPPESLPCPFSFVLDSGVKRAIAQMVLQGHYLGPPSTVPLGHGLEVFEEPCTIKPLEIGSFFSTPPPSGFTASSTVSRAPNRNTEPPGVILGRFEYLRALKGIHADSDDFSTSEKFP